MKISRPLPRLRPILLLPLLLAGFALSRPARAQEPRQYPINLSRPYHPGDTFAMQADIQCTSSRAIQLDGRVIDRLDSITSVSLRGTVTVKSVIQDTKVTSLLFAVDSLRYRQDNRQGELFYDKEILQVSAGTDHPSIKDHGREVGDFEHGLLDLLFPFVNVRSQARSEDSLFGTPNPVALAGQWSVNGQAILQPFLEAEANLKDAVFDGHGRLAGLQPAGGVDCMLVCLDVLGSGYHYPAQENLPNDFSSAFVSNAYLLPVNPGLPPMGMTCTNGLSSHFSGRALVEGRLRQRVITQNIGLARRFIFQQPHPAAAPEEPVVIDPNTPVSGIQSPR